MDEKKILIDALLELRGLAESGSLEMGTIDESLGKFGVFPWKNAIG